MRDPQIQALIPSSPGFAVVVTSQPAPQRTPKPTPKQVLSCVGRNPKDGILRESPVKGLTRPLQQTLEQGTTEKEPRDTLMQTPTTPVYDWSTIYQVDLANRSGQSITPAGDRDMDMGLDPETTTQNEPDSNNNL
jgi:hypothetical protein